MQRIHLKACHIKNKESSETSCTDQLESGPSQEEEVIDEEVEAEEDVELFSTLEVSSQSLQSLSGESEEGEETPDTACCPCYLSDDSLSFRVKTSGVSGSPSCSLSGSRSGRNWGDHSREISLDACFAQVFFIHSLSLTESSMLLLMAFDRFVVICNPLRYASILTPLRIAKMGLVFVLRWMALISPLPFLLKQFRYCRDNVLSHSYCLHQEVMKMACSDITVNSIYGLSVKLLTIGLDLLLIFLSYVMIIKTVLSVASPMECLRALNTCVSHLCAVLLFFAPEIGLSVIHRFGYSSSHLLQILLGYVYLLVPPLVNPIVYSVKSKHLRARIIRVFMK
ncbi:Olfactory receptor 51G2 [Chelonia mydas]|uniref:Olfactory receptor 51G2 n=1 Tax=Chelonia mydas TaxID=8469 RepID=M7AJC6_CHEMY|nr:Olfactory receptor 51G2 [Chelonia mydas]